MTNLTKRFLALGTATLCAAGILVGCGTTTTPQVKTNQVEKPQLPEQTSPMGERPIVTIEEDRFVFLNNGSAIEAEHFTIGEKVGEIAGGTLHKLGNYNPEFRMAFELEGKFYIVEKVAKADDSAMDIKAYLETADLASHIYYVDILDHMGANIMSSMTVEDTKAVLDVFKTATIADLSEKESEALASAQSNGKSFLLQLTLEDFTTVDFYVVPSLGYVSIGDYTCFVEDLDAKVGSFFEGLEVRENIIYN